MSDDDKSKVTFTGEQTGPDTFRAVRRTKSGDEPIEVQFVKDGDPIAPGDEVTTIDPECKGGWHTMTTLYKSGPAQVATPAYRDGWDRIFGKKPNVGLA